MRIKEITNQYGRDLYGKLECEHCGAVEKLSGGYDDANWHDRVLPARHCGKCGKNRTGEVKATAPEPNSHVAEPLRSILNGMVSP